MGDRHAQEDAEGGGSEAPVHRGARHPAGAALFLDQRRLSRSVAATARHAARIRRPIVLSEGIEAIAIRTCIVTMHEPVQRPPAGGVIVAVLVIAGGAVVLTSAVTA